MTHQFTDTILEILRGHYGNDSLEVFEQSNLLQYFNLKTKSAQRGSKSRSSFANLYAIYVVAEDYVNKGFHKSGDYSKYEGAEFSALFNRQRQLPFGEKLQNHALNNRVNSEYQKYFPNSELLPIIRNMVSKRYWINEGLLKVRLRDGLTNIASVLLEIIDAYIAEKRTTFNRFIDICSELSNAEKLEENQAALFIESLLSKQTDARVFEIVSYSILKHYYRETVVYWGYDLNSLSQDNLLLYKTGRTNANDGGIDFVMRPLGRFFQVTETLDLKKYFLDVDKIQKYPLTFVIKSEDSIENLMNQIQQNAQRLYTIESVVKEYMNCIEEIINIPVLKNCLVSIIQNNAIRDVLSEIVLQSKLEFNLEN